MLGFFKSPNAAQETVVIEQPPKLFSIPKRGKLPAVDNEQASLVPTKHDEFSDQPNLSARISPIEMQRLSSEIDVFINNCAVGGDAKQPNPSKVRFSDGTQQKLSLKLSQNESAENFGTFAVFYSIGDNEKFSPLLNEKNQNTFKNSDSIQKAIEKDIPKAAVENVVSLNKNNEDSEQKIKISNSDKKALGSAIYGLTLDHTATRQVVESVENGLPLESIIGIIKPSNLTASHDEKLAQIAILIQAIRGDKSSGMSQSKKENEPSSIERAYSL